MKRLNNPLICAGGMSVFMYLRLLTLPPQPGKEDDTVYLILFTHILTSYGRKRCCEFLEVFLHFAMIWRNEAEKCLSYLFFLYLLPHDAQAGCAAVGWQSFSHLCGRWKPGREYFPVTLVSRAAGRGPTWTVFMENGKARGQGAGHALEYVSSLF